MVAVTAVDGDALQRPGAAEYCNGEDDDCDGLIDEDFDGDGDGFSDEDSTECADLGPLDCDDQNALIYPGATELCDGRDNDCDGFPDCADPDCEELTCDDGSVCTEGDVCRMGVCGGAALDCDDGDGCTDDVCDPELGCSNPPNTAPCDDGSWCNGTDSCRDGLCQDHAAAPCAEFCNESTMACEMCAADGDCGAPSTGEWSACTGFSGTCDETGTRTRPVMTPRCTAGGELLRCHGTSGILSSPWSGSVSRSR